jgi:hypothetical protein
MCQQLMLKNMMRNLQVILTILSLIISVNLHSQESVVNSPVIGLRPGVFFNIGGYSPFTDETTVAGNLNTYLKIQKHEWYVGFLFPALIPSTQGYYYLNKSTIGVLAGYRYYLFNPKHKTNLFFQYEFQFIYFSGRVEEGTNSGYYSYNTIEEYVRNIFGLGFNQFFDKKQNIGISIGFGYIIPYEYYKRSGSNVSYSESTKWGDLYMNNYFNFSFEINIKLASFQKDKK